jgi:hypothetical protein
VLSAGFFITTASLYSVNHIKSNMSNGFGYLETSRDADGIIRSRTGELRSFEFPRRQRSLQIFNEECNKIEYPGIYLLLFGDKKTSIRR